MGPSDVWKRAREVWDEWNLRGAVLLSLFFQVVLLSLANKRRKSGGGVIGAIIWSAYLLADWIATFAVGLISSEITDDHGKATAVNKQLAVFWAPFLLLHLGGPDGITAFSLEDNELWIRHLMGVVVQVFGVVYVLVQSMFLENACRIPTVLVLLAGACKYVERTISLYKASLGSLKRSLLPQPDPGPDYALLMEDYSALQASHLPVTIDIVKETDQTREKSSQPEPIEMDALAIVKEGHRFFEIFKGLSVEHMFSFQERDESRSFFFARTAADAFRVMEVELNFVHDALHTKAPVVHWWFGYLCRFLCTALVLACLPLLATLPHQRNVQPIDRIVTHVLVIGAVALDVAGAVSLMLSDWTLVSAGEVARGVLIRLGSWRRERHRWSNRMGQHSFISFCLKEDGRFVRWINGVARLFRVEASASASLDELWYKKEVDCEEKLKKFVFNELRAKAEKAVTTRDAKEIYSARGGYVLCDYPIHYSHPSIVASLKSDEVEYDESLLMWHIATQLCYFTHEGPKHDRMELCKVLSDYMLYVLVMRPTLVSAIAGIAQIRFQDTCAEATMFFKRRKSEFTNITQSKETKACEMLLGVKTTDVKPKQVKGDRSKSLLFDACILAKDLMKLDEDGRWEMMSRIWVELLSYAATRCRPSDHARQLTQGGEFITFVWLLMVHFGLAEQFRIEAGDARAQLLVGKR